MHNRTLAGDTDFVHRCEILSRAGDGDSIAGSSSLEDDNGSAYGVIFRAMTVFERIINICK